MLSDYSSGHFEGTKSVRKFSFVECYESVQEMIGAVSRSSGLSAKMYSSTLADWTLDAVNRLDEMKAENSDADLPMDKDVLLDRVIEVIEGAKWPSGDYKRQLDYLIRGLQARKSDAPAPAVQGVVATLG